jgi:membrane-bound ClpP family serine protease
MAMSDSVSQNTMLLPLLAAGIVTLAFGVICIWIGTSVVSPIQEGEGFKISAIRFLIGGIVSIILAFIAKYFMFIKYLLKQISTKENQEETSFMIGISPSDCVFP